MLKITYLYYLYNCFVRNKVTYVLTLLVQKTSGQRLFSQQMKKDGDNQAYYLLLICLLFKIQIV